MATTIFVSILGDIFINNTANVVVARGLSDESSNLKGVTDSLSSLLGSTLEAYSAAQLMVLNRTTFTKVEVQSIAVVFGSSAYICSILAVNLAVCIVYPFRGLPHQRLAPSVHI